MMSAKRAMNAPSEPGALFMRAARIEPLSKSEANEIEGLIALSRSDDWKSSFIGYMLTEFREGRAAAPADVLSLLREALGDMVLQIDGAITIATDELRGLTATEKRPAAGRWLREAVDCLAMATACLEGTPDGEVADRLMDESAALLGEVEKNGDTQEG